MLIGQIWCFKGFDLASKMGLIFVRRAYFESDSDSEYTKNTKTAGHPK